MSVFIVDDSHELNSIEVKDWLIKLIESKAVLADSIKGAQRLLTKYSQELDDGTTLDFLYLNDDYEPLVINRKGEDVYCGYLLFGYKSNFGNPLPYLTRIVFDMDSNHKKISLRTKYLEVEARVEALKAEELSTIKNQEPKKADVSVKPTKKIKQVKEPSSVMPAKTVTKPSLSTSSKRVAKPNKVVAQYTQQSLF